MGMILLAWLPFQILNQPVCPPKGLAGSTKKKLSLQSYHIMRNIVFFLRFLSKWVGSAQPNQSVSLGKPQKVFYRLSNNGFLCHIGTWTRAERGRRGKCLRCQLLEEAASTDRKSSLLCDFPSQTPICSVVVAVVLFCHLVDKWESCKSINAPAPYNQ